MRCVVLFVAMLALAASPWAQPAPSSAEPLHKPFDELLDLYVRDGLVYYNALKSDRAKLDRYLRTIDGTAVSDYATWTPEKQLAFWINAYNAFVLRLVVDNYPIRGAASPYPRGSIRQVSGAFERQTFRAAGRTLTLDAIEKDVLTPFGDPRVFLALGRGALGGGRLRSEAFNGTRLDQQLTDVAAEAVDRKELVKLDQAAGVFSISPIFSWREPSFIAAFSDKAPAVYASRSPLERAVLALVAPYLLLTERDYLEQNSFKVQFQEFDWRLNDLTGGRKN